VTRRTRVWLGMIALAVVLGTAALAAVRVGALTGGSSLEPPRETITVDLPERGGRLVLDLPSVAWLAPHQARHVTVQRAGQDIIDTPLFPAAVDRDEGLALYWIGAEGRDGPYVRLADPGGNVLLDLRRFHAWRETTHGGQPWLVAPTDVSAAGSVADDSGTLTMIIGRPLAGLAAKETGVLLGRVRPDAEGLAWHPAARDEP